MKGKKKSDKKSAKGVVNYDQTHAGTQRVKSTRPDLSNDDLVKAVFSEGIPSDSVMEMIVRFEACLHQLAKPQQYYKRESVTDTHGEL